MLFRTHNYVKLTTYRSCNDDDSYNYEPKFGEKAAFRLKGIIRSDSGAIVVRYSTLNISLMSFYLSLFTYLDDLSHRLSYCSHLF